MGTGLRFIFGVMDNNDRQEIEDHLETIKGNNKNLIKNANEQFVINSKISEQINNITSHINIVQNRIVSEINKLDNKIEKINFNFKLFEIKFEIMENINLIQNQITNIKEIILSSKLKILSKNILTIIEEIKMYNITIEMYPYIKNCILLKNNTIIFVISLPNFTEGLCSNVIVEKIPNKNNELELNIEPTKVLICNKEIFKYISNYYVMKTDLIKFNDTCISNLLNNKEMVCEFRKNTKSEIKIILNNIVITKNLYPSLIYNNCSVQNEIKISGNNLIKFSDCGISLNEIKVENYEKEYRNKVLPFFDREIIIKNNSNPFNLEQIHYQNINNTKKIEEIVFQHSWKWYANIITDVMIVIVIIPIIITIIYLKYNFKSILPNIELKMIRREPNLKEGGVMSVVPSPPPIPNTLTSNTTNRAITLNQSPFN